MEEIITSFVIENKEFLLKNLPWYLIGGWTVYSLLIILSKSIREIISTYLIIQTIPNVFVTLGLFGTFCGIVFGLIDFNTSPDQIKESIPILLTGLKYAMFSSICGIFLSLLFGKVIRVSISKRIITPPATLELLELRKINKGFDKFFEEISTKQYDALKESMEKVLENFNEIFSVFLEDLVEQNFKELKETIDQLNDWQKKHRDEVKVLHETYRDLVDKHSSFVNKTEEWVSKLDEIAGQSSKLQIIINEFNDAFNEDGNMSRVLKDIQDSTTVLLESTENLNKVSKQITESSENVTITGDKITEWTEKVETVSENASEIIDKVDTIQKIEMKHIDKLVEEFNNKLKGTFSTFDTLIEKYIKDIENRINK